MGTAKVLVEMGLFTTIRPPQWWVACKCTKCLPHRSSEALTTTIKIRTLLLQTLQIRISNTSTRKYKTIWWTWASIRTDSLIINQIHHNLCHRTWGKIPVLFLDIKNCFQERNANEALSPATDISTSEISFSSPSSRPVSPPSTHLFYRLLLDCTSLCLARIQTSPWSNRGRTKTRTTTKWSTVTTFKGFKQVQVPTPTLLVSRITILWAKLSSISALLALIYRKTFSKKLFFPNASFTADSTSLGLCWAYIPTNFQDFCIPECKKKLLKRTQSNISLLLYSRQVPNLIDIVSRFLTSRELINFTLSSTNYFILIMYRFLRAINFEKLE